MGCKIELTPGAVLGLEGLVILPRLLHCNPSSQACTAGLSVNKSVSSGFILCVCVCD